MSACVVLPQGRCHACSKVRNSLFPVLFLYKMDAGSSRAEIVRIMKIKNIDHLVITTSDLKKCLDFYVGLLGMEHRDSNGHHNLYFTNGKISIHTMKGEFQPAARNPAYGSQDFCLITCGDLKEVKAELEAKHAPIISGIVERHGAYGAMQSLYLRDPDGNLVELSSYMQCKNNSEEIKEY